MNVYFRLWYKWYARMFFLNKNFDTLTTPEVCVKQRAQNITLFLLLAGASVSCDTFHMIHIVCTMIVLRSPNKHLFSKQYLHYLN